jgi:hypothetical protein
MSAVTKKRKINRTSGSSSSSSAPPLKRQKVVASLSSTSLSNAQLVARVAELEQQLQASRLELFEQQVKTERYGPFWNGTTNVDTMDYLNRLSPFATHYNANSADQFTKDIPPLLWEKQILRPFLGLEEVSVARRSCTFFQEHYERVLEHRTIRVPQDFSTVNKAMEVASMLAERIVFTKERPIKIVLDEGEHRIVGDDGCGQMLVTCSNISFIGKGTDKTFVLGGFAVKARINVLFQHFNVSNTEYGDGFSFANNATGEIVECAVKECVITGMDVRGGATVTASGSEFMENGTSGVSCHGANTKASLTDCTVHHNGWDGLVAWNDAVVDLHGTKTDIHSNKSGGILTASRAKVNIHLPARHNTSHDNVEEDRAQEYGGSIANINADGTFTHAVVAEGDDY